MSKSFLDSMLPSYTQFQPFTSSALSSVASLINLNNNNNNSSNSINNNIGSGNNNNNNNNSHRTQRNAGINLSLATSTTSDSGSSANSDDGNSSNSPTSLVHRTPDQSSANSTRTNATHKMYPYVSNHPSSHGSLSGMPGFSGLEDKSCR